jgi:NADPH-dependent 2,4-dienoyl-CoA reductase/sulfur reductase-like enzyme
VLPLQEADMISHHVMEHGVDLRLSTELKEIVGHHGKVDCLVTSEGDIVPCQFVGLTVGVSPNSDVAGASGIEVKRGIVVNEFLQTNVADVYAIGDCVERDYDLPGRQRIEQVWYTGRMMGEVVAQTVCGNATSYRPGPWFNSAKFFDIEYQTYGTVTNRLGENEAELYWEHKDRKKCIHFRWDKSTFRFLGVNAFGIRYRHECFDRWLREEKDIQFVMDHLHEANFDPEFFERHEQEIVRSFKNRQPQMA